MALRMLDRKATHQRKLAQALARAARLPMGSQQRALWLADAGRRRAWLVEWFPRLAPTLPVVPAQ